MPVSVAPIWTRLVNGAITSAQDPVSQHDAHIVAMDVEQVDPMHGNGKCDSTSGVSGAIARGKMSSDSHWH